MFYVYLLKNEVDEIYFGSTNDLRRRFAEHNTGQAFSTRNHTWRLAYYEAYFSENDAREREKQLKYHGQALAQLRRRTKGSFKES